jgi:hypothetical protein
MRADLIKTLKKFGKLRALPFIDFFDDVFPEGRITMRGMQVILLHACVPFFRRCRPVAAVCERRLLESYCLVFLATRADRMHFLRRGKARHKWKEAAAILGVSWRAMWLNAPPVPVLAKRSIGYQANGEALFEILHDRFYDSIFYRGFFVYARFRYLAFSRTNWTQFAGPFECADRVAVGADQYSQIANGKTGFTFSQISCVTLVAIGKAGTLLHHCRLNAKSNDILSEDNWHDLERAEPDKLYAIVSEIAESDILLRKLNALPRRPDVFPRQNQTP